MSAFIRYFVSTWPTTVKIPILEMRKITLHADTWGPNVKMSNCILQLKCLTQDCTYRQTCICVDWVCILFHWSFQMPYCRVYKCEQTKISHLVRTGIDRCSTNWATWADIALGSFLYITVNSQCYICFSADIVHIYWLQWSHGLREAGS